VTATSETQQRELDLDTARRTLWAEARGLGVSGMQAVMNVIMNRAARPGWWSRARNPEIQDHTVQAVCRCPAQFSCWLPDDPNLAKLLAVDDADAAFAATRELVEAALVGTLEDLTQGATYYHTITRPRFSKSWPPAWTHNPKHPIEECYRDKGHVFYRDKLKGV
jgi:N-acetylmuramoyl-L-alanine amidase